MRARYIFGLIDAHATWDGFKAGGFDQKRSSRTRLPRGARQCSCQIWDALIISETKTAASPECMSVIQDNPSNSYGKTTIYYIAPEVDPRLLNLKGRPQYSLGKADVFALAVFRTQGQGKPRRATAQTMFRTTWCLLHGVTDILFMTRYVIIC